MVSFPQVNLGKLKKKKCICARTFHCHYFHHKSNIKCPVKEVEFRPLEATVNGSICNKRKKFKYRIAASISRNLKGSCRGSLSAFIKPGLHTNPYDNQVCFVTQHACFYVMKSLNFSVLRFHILSFTRSHKNEVDTYIYIYIYIYI